MSDIDVYPHETEVRVKLTEWKRWTLGEGATVASNGRCLDNDVINTREINRPNSYIHTNVSEAEKTDRALRELRAQSSKQHAALLHYHFKSTDGRSITRAASLAHHSEVTMVLRHAHENFRVIRASVSIKAALLLDSVAVSGR